jgi:glycosyltransferase involved in cell wall biosynthesis
MPLISIIIPVYNVEKYLRRCLDSILAQTLTDYECILVDDGSPDNCSAICDEYTAKDQRIITIHQENRGTAHARDAGIKKAQGIFLVFVDGDDWIEPHTLETLYHKQRETGADIVMGGARNIYPSASRPYYYPAITNGANILVYYFLNNCKTLWGKLYKKALFDNYIIPNTNVGEDAMVTIQIFSKITPSGLQKVDEVLYNYDRRTDGIIMRLMNQFSYTTYLEDPAIRCRLWIENYLIKETNQDKETLSAFMYYMMLEGIIPYLQNNKMICKNEAVYFYTYYYLRCSDKNKIILPLRI